MRIAYLQKNAQCLKKRHVEGWTAGKTLHNASFPFLFFAIYYYVHSVKS